MQEFVGQLVGMLNVEDPTSTEALHEGETRARAMLEVSTAVLHAHVDRAAIIDLFARTLDAASPPGRDPTILALLATPSEQLADALHTFLQRQDAADPVAIEKAHAEARAMILAGATFLRERHGGDNMLACVGALVAMIQAALPAEGQAAPTVPELLAVEPVPFTAAAPIAAPRQSPTMNERIGAMTDFLRGSSPEEAKAEALAAIMASGVFLRERFGEGFAVGALRQVEATVSRQAALDRWQPASGAAH